jgi:hypothetical protein
MTEKTYTGASLEQALRYGSLTPPGIVLVGMVKASEKGEHVLFTRSGCETWVDLPVAMIEHAEHVGQNACKDHSHPIMKITLKEPKDPVAQIYSALLAQQPTSAQMGHMREQQRWPGSNSQDRPVTQRGVAYRSPFMSSDAHGGGTASPANPFPRTSARIGGGVGTGRLGLGARLGAWGCWDTECCDCAVSRCWPTGDGREICECLEIVCEPCERCIWPY